MLKIHVGPGEEVMTIVRKTLKENNIQNGAIVTIIGAVDECIVSTMPKDDAKKDILKKYNQPLELSGTGEITDGKPHIHCVLSEEGNKTISGHLHSATVKNWFVNIYILPL